MPAPRSPAFPRKKKPWLKPRPAPPPTSRRRKRIPSAWNAALAEAESLLETLTSRLAGWNADKASNERGREVASALLETLPATQLADARARLDRGDADRQNARPTLASADRQTEEARKPSYARLRDSAAAAREQHHLAMKTAEASRRAPRWKKPSDDVQRRAAEVKALGDLLHPEGEGLFPCRLIDAVRVQAGYEAALAACLGDDLQGAAGRSRAVHHWRDLDGRRRQLRTEHALPLPAGARAPPAISSRRPAALARRLAMTGLVFPDQGAALQKQLMPGQCLVSARGDLWRWDGYAASADAPSPAALRLSQRNRLAVLEQELTAAKEIRGMLFTVYSQAKDRRYPRARQAGAPGPKDDERQIRTGVDRGPGRKSYPRRPRPCRAQRPACQPGSGDPPPLEQSVEAAKDAGCQADVPAELPCGAGADLALTSPAKSPKARCRCRRRPPGRVPAAKPVPRATASGAKAKCGNAALPRSGAIPRAGTRAGPPPHSRSRN